MNLLDIAVLAVLVGPELLSLMMDSRMEGGHLFHQGDSVRVQLFLRGITDFLHNPVFGIGLISQRNSALILNRMFIILIQHKHYRTIPAFSGNSV